MMTVSGAAKEAGRALTDIVKTFRLFTLPFQYGALLQDRLSNFLQKVRDQVPPERQLESPAMISGPILERLSYLEENNPLTELFLNLLAKSIDRERISEAHPAFIHIIGQLSTDEALILFQLTKEPLLDIIKKEAVANNSTSSRIKTVDGIKDHLYFPVNTFMYLRHLESLNLVQWVRTSSTPVQEMTSYRSFTSKLIMTDFGQLFARACIPEKDYITFVPEVIKSPA